MVVQLILIWGIFRNVGFCVSDLHVTTLRQDGLGAGLDGGVPPEAGAEGAQDGPSGADALWY